MEIAHICCLAIHYCACCNAASSSSTQQWKNHHTEAYHTYSSYRKEMTIPEQLAPCPVCAFSLLGSKKWVFLLLSFKHMRRVRGNFSFILSQYLWGWGGYISEVLCACLCIYWSRAWLAAAVATASLLTVNLTSSSHSFNYPHFKLLAPNFYPSCSEWYNFYLGVWQRMTVSLLSKSKALLQMFQLKRMKKHMIWSVSVCGWLISCLAVCVSLVFA